MSKRLFDVVVAALGLALLLPLFLVIALLIGMDSRGPIFFRQRRVGKGLRSFTLYKFRTMVAGCAGSELTVANDYRVTRIGEILRRSKLDELPQLVNILKGDMSFVGPRPLVESTVERFREQYRVILRDVRPGVTDPASIKYRNESEVLGRCLDPVEYYFGVIIPDKLRMQRLYQKHQPMMGDFKILLMTVAACCGFGESGSTHAYVVLDRWTESTVRMRLPPTRYEAAGKKLWTATHVWETRSSGDELDISEIPMYQNVNASSGDIGARQG